jgi:hypothetical protein
MIRRRTSAFVSAAALGGLCFLAGCNKGSSNETAPPTQPTAATASTNPETAAIVRATSDFMDAVLKGDIQRASTRLTPQAMQRITASGLQFAPPGLSTETFKIAQVRTPQVDKAYVLCIVSDNASATSRRQMEMACILRRIENDWRVSGIAAWDGPSQAGFTTDFETGQTMPIPRDPAMSGTGAPTGSPPMGTPAPPPRMATEPAAPAPR